MQNVFAYFLTKNRNVYTCFLTKNRNVYIKFLTKAQNVCCFILKCVISGLFAQKFSHLFYLRTIVLHIFQIILFHGLILHFFFIEPLSCFSLRCKQHCLILWRKYLIEATGWFVQHAIVVHIFSAKYRFNASANFFAFLTWTAYSTGLYGSPSITGTCHTKIHFFISLYSFHFCQIYI